MTPPDRLRRHAAVILIAVATTLCAATAPAAASGPATAQPTPADAGTHTAARHLPRTYVVPGAKAYPEGIATDARTGDIYAGSLTSGTIYRTPARHEQLQPYLDGTAHGHTSSFGMKIDRHGRLIVIGGLTNPSRVYVYDLSTKALLGTFSAAGPVLLNDLTITADGHVYLTDSLQPRLYRIRAHDLPTRAHDATPTRAPDAVLPVWRTISGVPGSALPPFPDYDGFNGIAVGDHDSHLVVAANSGELYVIGLHQPTAAELDTGPAPIFADGLLTRGTTLYAVDAFTNRIEVIALPRLHDPNPRGRRLTPLTDPALDGPSTAAFSGNDLLVSANFQGPSFFFAGPAPQLPFTLRRLPVPDAGARR